MPDYGRVDTIVPLFGSAIVIVLVFDVVDLFGQLGSFHFFRTTPFGVYVLYRGLLGVAAAILLAALQPAYPPLLIGLVAGLFGFTLLQNFGVKVGEVEKVSLSEPFQKVRDKIITQEGKRLADARQTEVVMLAQALAKQVDHEQLKHAFLTLRQETLQRAGVEQPWVAAQAALDSIKELAKEDEPYEKLVIASEIAQQNGDFARRLLAQPRIGRLEQ